MLNFYKNKRVFITGHTGFKGGWLCCILAAAGAEVTGFALDPPTMPSFFDICKVSKIVDDLRGDIRDIESLERAIKKAKPEIVIHMAAQPLVIEGYNNPKYTYETNVLGTVNLLECARKCPDVRSIINVTTDKVYRNNENGRAFVETDYLGGLDPYSNSKSCSDLITSCYNRSFFHDNGVGISSVRAGNVIGGGDFADNRIVPDCVRSALNHEKIVVRNPDSVRPFQHVLESLFTYLTIAQAQYKNISMSGSYNIGPDKDGCVSIIQLASMFCELWGGDANYVVKHNELAPHEAGLLRLECSLAERTFAIKPCWSIRKAVDSVCKWSKAWQAGENMQTQTLEQIKDFDSVFRTDSNTTVNFTVQGE